VINYKFTVIVQARTGSSRLPGKIFKNLSGKPVLWHVWDRLSHSKLIDKIVIATTDLPEDDGVEKFCEENLIPFYRGSSHDVLSRYYEAAKKFNADIIIRVTSDCPVVDPIIIDQIAAKFVEINKKERLDYMSNSIVRTFPRGLDAEIFTFSVLDKSFKEALKEYEREHVTPYIYQHPELFNIEHFTNEVDYSFHRWTVDTKEDYELIHKIYSELYQPGKLFLFKDILDLFERKPELLSINQNIKQKSLGE
jgi:spore coat polysaccharide biosynthesis protein SpsF